MQTDAYTADAICQCMGLLSFDGDLELASASEAVRLLLKPSFHPEVCITIADAQVSVVSARSMIWRMFEPAPVLTDRAQASLSSEAFDSLLRQMQPVKQANGVPGIVIDGMPTDLLHIKTGKIVLRVGGNAGGRRGDFSAFVSAVIRAVWDLISNVHCRNALADTAGYVGESLPRLDEPPRKPTVATVVLGPAEERAELLAALKRHSES